MKNAFFSPLTMKMKCVLCIKESYSKGKRIKIFTFAFGTLGAVTPPSYGQPDRKMPVFFSVSLRPRGFRCPFKTCHCVPESPSAEALPVRTVAFQLSGEYL